MNNFMKFFCVFALFFIVTNAAQSSERHKHSENVVNTTITEIRGTASAIAASQHQFYWGTKAWQGSVGIGAYDKKTAFSFGMAKRFNKTLINGNITQEEGRFGGGVGVNWLF